METSDVPRIPLQLSRDCVVASIQVDLSAEVLQQFQSSLLELIHTSGARGIILDVSGVQVLDLEDFEALRRTVDMAALMGARTIISGLRPGVVSSLVELDADTESIEATLNLDEAFLLMEEGASQGTLAAANMGMEGLIQFDVDEDDQEEPFANI